MPRRSSHPTPGRFFLAVSSRFRVPLFIFLLTAVCVLVYFSPTLYTELWFKRRQCIAYTSSSSSQRETAVNSLLSQSRTTAANRSVAPLIFRAAANRSGVPGSLTTLTGPVTIFTHGWHDYISHSILSHRGWEDENRHTVERLLMSDPGLQFLDFGSNIGAFSLTAAQHRRKVVAVDANRRNLALLARSVAANPGFSQRVTLINNALGNAHGKVVLHVNPDNIGGSGVVGLDSRGAQSSNVVDTVLLDDLLPVIPFRRAVIKIDIEANEHLAMAGAKRFFEQMDVPYILMEWSGQMEKLYESVKHPGAAFLYRFLRERGYEPFGAVNGQRLSENFCSWPQDILFKKKR